MTKREDGGPAFPQSDLSSYGMGPSEINNGGMTLRDWFAGQALVGLAAHYGTPKGAEVKAMPERAYTLADAMLKAREVSHEA